MCVCNTACLTNIRTADRTRVAARHGIPLFMRLGHWQVGWFVGRLLQQQLRRRRQHAVADATDALKEVACG